MSIYPGLKDLVTSTQLDRLYILEEGGKRYLDIELKSNGDIVITTEGNDCCLSFDEFRAKFFPTEPAKPKFAYYAWKGKAYGAGGPIRCIEFDGRNYVKVYTNESRVTYQASRHKWIESCIRRGLLVEIKLRYVPKKGYFNERKMKCVERRGDKWFYVFFDGTEQQSHMPWDTFVRDGQMIEGEVKRYVNVQGYFVGDVKYIEDRGGDNVVSVFNGGGEVHFGRENLDDCIARGAYVEGDVRRFQSAQGPLFKCGTMYVEVCSNGKAYCVRPDGTRNPFLGARRMTPHEFAEQAVRKGAWVEL